MLNIYVDADSCPVKDEVIRVSRRYGLEVYMISNSWILQVMGPKVHKILVSAGADAADNWIAEHIQQNDIAITADILLAERCLKKSAYVIGPKGKSFTEDNIGVMVAMRNLNTHLREIGEISGYNQSFLKQDRSRFLQELESVIQKIK
ncbi:MAG: YaiI/YqxD family protein [Rickettsiales bacterium]|jgi:uncharacterized protein YaiI (UPF0178 family)|nr:YaiI/YqxD family protein [Rickettsiales bacterium]